MNVPSNDNSVLELLSSFFNSIITGRIYLPFRLPAILANFSISCETSKESDLTSDSLLWKKKFIFVTLSFFTSIKLSEKNDNLFFSNYNLGLYKSTAVMVYLSIAR